MLIDLHKSRFTKINELATHKSGNYVLMAPVANKYGSTASQAFQAAHSQQYQQIEHSFLNLINPNVLHTNTTQTVAKAIEAASLACKQNSQNANFFNEAIIFRSPKQYAEMRVEKDKKAKILAQQQQQQTQQHTSNNNGQNTQINITATSSNTKQVQNQSQQSHVVTQKPTITTQLSNSGQQKNISITPTQQSAPTMPNQSNSTSNLASSPSSPTVSTLLNNSNIICKTTPNIRNINSNTNSATIVKSSQNSQNTYYQVQQSQAINQQQQQPQRISLDINNSQTAPGSPVSNMPKSGQQPVRLFTASKSQPITELRKHGSNSTPIVQQQGGATTLLKQATSNTQIQQQQQQQKKDTKQHQQHQQQQLPQISTIAATGASKIEQTKPTTMIISSNPSYTTSANNSTQISIQSTPTTLITTTSNINKSPAVIVKQNSAIKTATIASPPLSLPTTTGATLITNQTNFQHISRQQIQQSTPPPMQTTNNIVLTSTSTTSINSPQVTVSSASTSSPATFAALIKPLNNVNTVTLSLSQQKLPQASEYYLKF